MFVIEISDDQIRLLMPGITDIKVEVIKFRRCGVFDLKNWCSICDYFIKYLAVTLELKNFNSLPFFTTYANVCDPGSAADIRVFKGIIPLNWVLKRIFQCKKKNYFQAPVYKQEISEIHCKTPQQFLYFLLQYSQKSLDIFGQVHSSCRQ